MRPTGILVAALALLLLLAAGGGSLHGLLAQAGSTPERTIARYVDTNNASALALLERVVNVNSGTHNLAGVREVGRIFRAEFDALGFETKWVDGAAWHRAGHLVAEHPGSAPRLLLIGHLDTVFEPDSPFQRFQRIGATEARGPGVIDMKGGDVIIVQALKALNAAGALKTMNLAVVMTGDEEDPGRPLSRAREALINLAAGSEAAIGFEDGPGDPREVVTARRGTSRWELRVNGTAAHSSQIFRPDVGGGAVFEMARILEAFRQKMAGEEHLTFNPGVILGGTRLQYDRVQTRGTAFGKDNVIAGQAVASGDLRALSVDQLERAKRTMLGIVAASLAHTDARLTFDEGYPPLPPSAGGARLLELYSRVSQDLGFGPVRAASPDRAGAADVSFVAGRVAMTLDGIGLKGHDDHTPNETADLATLRSQTKRAAVLLLRLAGHR